MSADLVACRDDDAWDAFVARSPQGSVFTRSWFLRALDVDVERWFWRQGDEVKAAVTVFLRDGRAVEALRPFCMYQGILWTRDTVALPAHRAGHWFVDHTARLLDALASRYDALAFCLHPSFVDLRGIQWFRYGAPDMFRLDLRYTGLLDLSVWRDFDSYLADIRGSRRREYVKSRVAGLTVEASTDVDLLDRLHGLTFARQGLSRADDEIALLRSLTRAALARRAGDLLVCRDAEGNAAAASLFVRDDTCAYYLFGARDPARDRDNAGGFVVLEALRDAFARGIRRADFCGVNSPQRGDFKTSLGGVPSPYFLATWKKGGSNP